MSILHKSYKKIYPIIKEFEKFCVNETTDDRNFNMVFKDKNKGNEEFKKLKKRLDEQEQLVVHRIEEFTKDEKVNLENLLGFINQKKLHSFLNISNIMRLSKLDFSDLYYIRDLDLMLVRKTLLEKVSS